jgi:hypothetical protein
MSAVLSSIIVGANEVLFGDLLQLPGMRGTGTEGPRRSSAVASSFAVSASGSTAAPSKRSSLNRSPMSAKSASPRIALNFRRWLSSEEFFPLVVSVATTVIIRQSVGG